MVLAAFFGMATKYSEGLLAVKYRVIGKEDVYKRQVQDGILEPEVGESRVSMSLDDFADAM